MEYLNLHPERGARPRCNRKTKRAVAPALLAAVVLSAAAMTGCSSSKPSESGSSAPDAPSSSSAVAPTSVVSDSSTKEGSNTGTGASAGLFVSSNPGGGGAFSSGAIGSDGLLVVGSDLSGAYISNDYGESWHAVGAAQGLEATHVSAVALVSRAPDGRFGCDSIVLGTDAGVWSSEDCGSSFVVSSEPGYVTAFGMSGPSGSDDDGSDDRGKVSVPLYAAISSAYDESDSKMYRVDEEGRFVEQDSDLPNGFLVLQVRVDPTNPERLLVIGGDGRFASGPAEVLVSDDGGLTWLEVTSGHGPVVDATFGAGGGLLVSAFDLDESVEDGVGGLYVMAAGQTSWHQILDQVGVIWTSTLDAQNLRVVDVEHQYPWDDKQGVWETSDGGTTWKNTAKVANWGSGWSIAQWVFGPPFEGVTKTLSFDSQNYERSLWVNSQFVYATNDGGKHFDPLFSTEAVTGSWSSTGIDNVVVADVEVSAANPGTWIVGYWDLGCFRSLNAGSSWQNCNDLDLSGDWGGAGGFMGTVVSDPERPGVVWAALGQDWETSVALVSSVDLAESWQVVADRTSGVDVLGMSLDLSSDTASRRLFVTIDGHVYRSQDDGASWQLVLECGGCRTTMVTLDGVVFAGGEAGLWRSDSSGDSWNQVGSMSANEGVVGPPWTYGWQGVSSLAEGPAVGSASGSLLYATVYSGSPETGSPETGGAESSGPESGSPGLGDSGGSVAVQPGGVYVSKDGGVSWRRTTEVPYARSIAADRATGVLWLGTSSAYEAGGYDPTSTGLSRRLDGGDTWEEVDVGLPFPFVSEIVIDGDGLVLSSPGVGVGLVSDPQG